MLAKKCVHNTTGKEEKKLPANGNKTSVKKMLLRGHCMACVVFTLFLSHLFPKFSVEKKKQNEIRLDFGCKQEKNQKKNTEKNDIEKVPFKRE